MANQQHIDWLLEGVDAWNARRGQDDFIPDFSGADLTTILTQADIVVIDRIDLYSVNFSDADLTNTDLSNAYLESANLKNAILTKTNFANVAFGSADLEGAQIWGTNFSGIDSYGITIGVKNTEGKNKNTIPKNVTFEKSNFNGANLEGANFEKINLAKASFNGANFEGAKFNGTSLKEATFEGANLEGAVFNGNVDLRWADFKKAILIGTSFNDSLLEGADLRGATLEGQTVNFDGNYGTGFKGTSLIGVNVRTTKNLNIYDNKVKPHFISFKHCRDLTKSQLETMHGDTGVILPEGWEHPAHWPKWDEGENPQKESAITIVENELPFPSTQVQASTALKNQVRFVLETAPAAQDGANLATIQISTAIGKFIEETQLNTSDEIEIFTGISNIFDQLANALDINQNDAAKIQELETIIASQKAELERLTRLLENQPSIRSQIMVAALGAAGGTALTGTTAYFFGPEGADIITNIVNYIASNPATPIPQSLTVG